MTFSLPNLPATPTPMQSAQSSPDSVDFAIFTAAFGGSGVLSGCAVTWSAALSFAVASGTVRTAGSARVVTVAAATVALGAGDATNPRFDLIVASSAGVATARAGTAAPNPVFPPLTTGDVALAAVYVPAGATVLSGANIVAKGVVIPATGGADSTITVAAANSSAQAIAGANYLCTGTNDQVQINAAIAALPSFGGRVLMTAGDYYLGLGGVFINRDNVTLEGEGTSDSTSGGTTLHLTAGLTGPAGIDCTSGSSPNRFPGNLTLRNFMVDGTNGPAASNCINYGSYIGLISRVTVCYAKGKGLYTYPTYNGNSTYDCAYEFIDARNCTGAGIHTNSPDTKWSNITPRNNTGIGFIMDSGGALVSNMMCYYNLGGGVQIENGSARILFSNCKIEQNQHGVIAYARDNYDITGTLAISAGAVTSATLTAATSKHYTAPYWYASGGGGTGASGHANVDNTGTVTSLTVDAGGSGYTSAPTLGWYGSGGPSEIGFSNCVFASNNLTTTASDHDHVFFDVQSQQTAGWSFDNCFMDDAYHVATAGQNNSWPVRWNVNQQGSNKVQGVSFIGVRFDRAASQFAANGPTNWPGTPEQTLSRGCIGFADSHYQSKYQAYQAIGTGQTVSFTNTEDGTQGEVMHLGPTTNVTNVIMPVLGTPSSAPGQRVTLVNVSAFTITFATDATSNVFNGLGTSIPPGGTVEFQSSYSTNRWYAMGSSTPATYADDNGIFEPKQGIGTAAFIQAASTTYYQYLGRARKAYTSAVVRLGVTTAGVTLSFAEVGIFKGSITTLGTTPLLTKMGTANATLTAINKVSTTVALTGIQPGDDLWVAVGVGTQGTAVQYTATVADGLSTGIAASNAARPSTTTTTTPTVTAAAMPAIMAQFS